MSSNKTRFVTFALSCVLALATFNAVSEDIDIFSVDEDNTVDNPNVLIILDNSANWSRQAQQWPGGLTQGQSEVRAIKNVINQLPDGKVNVGLMMYSTGGASADRDGGYVRFHIRTMNGTNKATLASHLDTIFNNINSTDEKRDSSNPFGDLFWDAYNYLSGGFQSHNGAGTPASRADSAAYSTQYSRFRSPLTALDGCRRTIIIFIGNNRQNGPYGDSAANVSALSTAGGNTAQIPWPNYTVQSTPATDDLGYSTACYNSVAACSSAEDTAACRDKGYTSCSCSSTSPISCGGEATSKFTVFGVNTTETVTTVSNTSSSETVSLGPVQSCKNAQQAGNLPAVSCPASSSSVTQSGSTRTTTTTSYSNCGYVNIGSSGCQGGKSNYEPRGTKTTQTLVENVTTTTTRTNLGETGACYTSASTCSTAGFNCAAYNGGCVCDVPTNTSGCSAASTGNKYKVQGNYTQTVATAVPGSSRTPPTQAGKNFMMDEWAKFLRQVGVPLPGTNPVVRAQVTTYTIDVFNAQQDADSSSLLFTAAQPNVGGGRYYQAKNENQIQTALGEIFAEVQAVNTAFASASLPVSATNRAQNENQVFIGLFRPDRVKKPRWFGNLKRFQIVASGNELLLGDKDGRPAINNLTGFLSDCSASYWTTDSGNYWLTVGTDDPPAVGLCTTSGTSAHSDLPDGPFVEKGAVAEVLRRGNNRTPASDGSGNFLLNRSVKTRTSSAGSALVAFNSTNAASVDSITLDYTLGKDVGDDDGDGNLTEPRSTIHGDVVHSRPLPVNYGGSTGVVVYYGANDGALRAVKAETGEELWSFIAPEHFGKLARLKDNTPLIKYPGDTGGARKEYFFDGSFGLLQKLDNSAVWIFPSMRRGGRKVYALDVTNPASPIYKWSKGCPNLDNDTGCDTGSGGDFSGIGQTWSQPAPAFVANYDRDGDPGTDNAGQSPLVVFGGGYDGCEDLDQANLATACTAAKGRRVYVVDADDGKLIQSFTTERSVAADIALVDINFDSKVDYGYAVDTGGAVYRIDFTLLPWSMTKVASTTGDGRKFLFAPALLQTRTEDGEPVIYVAVGSGDREHPLRSDYPYADPIVNRFYVFKDYPAQSLSLLDLDGNDMLDKSTPDGADQCDSTKVLPDTDKRGWYIDLVDYGRGEQTVTSAAIAGGQVFFSTNRAEPPNEEVAACTSSLGEARGYVLDIVSGLGRLGPQGACGERSSAFAGGGLPPSPVIATVPVEGHGVQTVCIGCGGRDSPLDTGEIKTNIPSIRRPIYWYTSGDTE
ncbi:PilC/PilY family type IV pilus protein [Fontimonas sp. SYSU GA230001]|uniref:pilus assembly protein n=1 Tax=Fontimonas sp. SYSU GA230001 TaxID=3142450 RepID=UPI0032B31C5B